MSSPTPFPIRKHDIISSRSERYLVLDFNGEGCFGKVAKCVNIETFETTAIKIHKQSEDYIIQREVAMLKEVRALDPEKKNLVRFIDNFMFQDMSCLAFEMLDRSLWDLIIQRQGALSINEIRPITHQLLVAFEALKGIGIIHTDLKPDNIMLVNHRDEPFRVKLIDFGLAIPASEAEVGMTMQPLGYRAPEVDLGLPITEAVDMWGLGCVMAFLYFGTHLFPGESTYHAMAVLCHLVGHPGDHLLNAGKNTCQYFRRKKSLKNPGWKLKTLKEYKQSTGLKPKNIHWFFSKAINLDDAVESHYEVHDYVEHVDRIAYLDLLKRLLDPDGVTRITPEQALQHCFVTMHNLKEDRDTSCYANAAFELMTVCPLDDSNESLDFLRDIQSTDSHVNNSSYDDDDHQAATMSSPAPFQIKKHDILSNKFVHYLVLDFNGEGCFGKVAKCVNIETSETTAIKIHKQSEDYIIQREVAMLKEVRALDPEKKNLVRFIDNFMFQDMSCLAFEMLDRSLWDLIIQRQGAFSINEIRPITHQLLVAFEALKGIGIIHTDLKPDNIMLVNHRDEPFRVKLIDFGLAIPASEAEVGMTMQPLGYRAPEVDLGLPITEAVDMWGLGCVMAFLYFGTHLFPGESTYHAMAALCHLVGHPGDHLLNAGKNTCQYFRRKKSLKNPGWKLKTLKEYKQSTGLKPKNIHWFFSKAINLDDAVESHYEVHDYVEHVDRIAYLDLLKRLLDPDSVTRITPEQALQHCFVTMHNLKEDRDTSCYANAAFELMTVCPLDDSNESLDFLRDIQSTDSHVNNSSYDDDDHQAATMSSPAPFQIKKHDILSNKCVHYLVLDFNGEGCFGKVAKCVNIETSETTAIKIHKESEDYTIQREVAMLKEVRALDPEKKNLVRFIDNFMFQGMSCLAFEMLDRSLWDLINQRQGALSINEIHPITHQLLVAFEALKGIGIIHTDLKPDNIMLVNHRDEPFRVKLIDFGLAIPASEAEVGMTMQPLGYRAPEVDLGLPITEAVDMWGLGCVMAFLYFGTHLFPGESTYHAMAALCHLVGHPGDHLLNAGKNTCQYFRRKKSLKNPGWKLKTLKEYKQSTGLKPKNIHWFFSKAINLDDAVESHYEVHNYVEHVDRIACLDLTPEQVLQQCFITVKHLDEDADTNSNADAASELMTVCPLDDPNESLDFLRDIQSTDSHVNKSSYADDDHQACNDDPWKHMTAKMSSPEPIANVSYDDRAASAANLPDDVRDIVTSTHEESGAASTSDYDNSDAACVPIDDRASAAAGSSDGASADGGAGSADRAAATTTSNEGPAAAITPVLPDVDDVNIGRDRAGRRVIKFFRRMKRGVISFFRRQGD